MSWKIIETDEESEDNLTDSELIGISILLGGASEDMPNDLNVYFRALRKIQPMARTARGREAQQ